MKKNKGITAIDPMQPDLMNRMACRLIHSRIPKRTGKMIYDKILRKKVREIILVCKEGCDDKEVNDES